MCHFGKTGRHSVVVLSQNDGILFPKSTLYTAFLKEFDESIYTYQMMYLTSSSSASLPMKNL
ncbi:hypothetical protein HMPREF9151_02317 [Hoylesella saccharolytica F0055]|uniref:Uncharacterized protein n=1 Tax=Hoylesella saccharolytica F0055 TaxID=1127699 RepID=L1N152_9BACT|nr:hypothetical protein HMPREF9151_02317 [Hoylesella saccharolytica F0055]